MTNEKWTPKKGNDQYTMNFYKIKKYTIQKNSLDNNRNLNEI